MSEALEFYDSTYDVRITTKSEEIFGLMFYKTMVQRGEKRVLPLYLEVENVHDKTVADYLKNKEDVDEFFQEWPHVLPITTMDRGLTEWLFENDDGDHIPMVCPVLGRFIGFTSADTAFHYKMRWL